ncbi:MAG: peptidyl-tRNA hydrolase Pth2 [DPANN group archaeon]|nr:peptidyl-tRNA hydrolase Pth2 [DPANN group archaeon]
MLKQMIVVRKDLKMTRGKMSAQVAHASLEAFLKTQKQHPDKAKKWRANGMKKIVLEIDSKEALLALKADIGSKIPTALITDAGHTQLEPGTITCLGIGPFDEEEIDKYTGHLKLIN